MSEAGMEIVSSFRSGAISAESLRGDCLTLDEEPFDIAFLFSSWDSRCLTPTSTELRARKIVLSLFDNKGTSGARDLHDRLLLEFAAQRAATVDTIVGESESVDSLWPKYRSALAASATELGRPLRVYVDLSAACRYYALGVIAQCLSGLAFSVDVSYSEGAYPNLGGSNDSMGREFRVGRWESLAVPNNLGEFYPSKKSSWVVGLGFEGSKTYRAVSKADPDCLTVLVPRPGFTDAYAESCMAANRPLFDDYAIEEDKVLSATAGDAVGAWSVLADANIEELESANVSYVCAGTKPHSLAFLLRALELESPGLLYLKPVRHKEVLTIASGVYWRYKILDHSLVEFARMLQSGSIEGPAGGEGR